MQHARHLTAAYRTLGLSNGASLADTKARHRQLAVAHHPDKGGCAEKMRAINEAYALIKESGGGSGGEGRAPGGAEAAAAPGSPAGRHRSHQQHQRRDRDPDPDPHNVFGYTQVRVAPQRAGPGTQPRAAGGKVRNFEALLRGARGSDRHGPKLQAKNTAHWGRAYGKYGVAGAVEEKDEGGRGGRRCDEDEW